MAERILIRDMKANQAVYGVYAVHNCQLGQTKTGKHFIKCLLSDRSGRTPGRLWNASQDLFRTLPTDGFVWIEGQTQPYQGEMQIIMQQIRRVEPSPEDLAELLPRTKRDVDEMFAELSDILGSLTSKPLVALTKAYLADEALMERFRQAPAAMTLHHAYLGGLLEHTLTLLQLAQRVCPVYEHLNVELVVTGLFLHDLGKCVELTWQAGFGYSDDGNLVGHVARGVIWLEAKAQACADAGTPIPVPLLQVLHHIVLSHHGEPQFGALKVPATPEAIAVSMLDNLDAKVHMALAATRWGDGDESKDAALGGNFTEKVWALDTRLYRPDPTAIEEPPSEQPAESSKAPAKQRTENEQRAKEGVKAQLWSDTGLKGGL